MIGRKHILAIFLVAITTLVSAQESYVVDSVCVGADRTYRRDGEKLYTFDWYIRDTLGNDLDNPADIPFTDIAGTDTIWGSEITYQWLDVGQFDVVVFVYTEHGCDTLEQGQIKVFDPPEADAGDDEIICKMADIELSGDSAWYFSTLFWTSTGDGSFSNQTALHPVYALGAADSLSNTVTLILTAWGLADNGTCTPAVDSVNFFFSSPEIAFTVQELLCFNDSNASIKATITDGLPPYTYSWEGPPGFSAGNQDSIFGLWAGLYTLTVTDYNGCVDVDSVWIVDPPLLIAAIDSVSDVSCYGYADGYIYASASGGTGAISFAWISDSGFTASGDSIFGLAGDTYLLTVTDENGCTDTVSVVVNEPDPLIAAIDEAIDITCYGDNNGAAHVTVTDGSGPFSYAWNTVPQQDSVWAVDLGPGEYIVTITDANGCAISDTVIINEPPPLVFAFVDSTEVRCDGAKPGEIDIELSGGTPFATAPYYTYVWTNEAGAIIATTQDVQGLEGNQYYTVLVSDSLGCQLSRSIYVDEIPMMQLEVSIDSALCYGDRWSIDLTVSQGRPPYQYQWTNASGATISTSEDLLDVVSGFYALTISDSDSCTLYREFDLEEPPLLLAEIMAGDSLLCQGDELVLQGTTTGGSGVITHSWTGSGAAFLSADNVIAPTFGNAPAGDYELIYTIVDEANCDAADTFAVVVYPPTYSFDSIQICMGSAPFTWNSLTILSDQDREYSDTLYGVNQYGCDSLLFLAVDVLFPEYYDTTIYACANEAPFVVHNHTILPDRDSIYLDTLSYAASGCDSLLVTIEVFTLPLTDTLLDTTLCAGAPEFVWNNVTIFTENDSIYHDTLVNRFGCDSLLTYDVKISPPDTFFVDTIFCQNEPAFVWNEVTIQTQNDSSYQARLTNRYGCDSLVYLNVNLLPVSDTLIDTLLCYGSPAFAWNNLVVYAERDSTYTDTLVNEHGCDSLLFLEVNILPVNDIFIDTFICEDEPAFVWNEQLVQTQNDSSYFAALQNVHGCDSLLTLNVNILRKTYSYTSDTINDIDIPYVWNDSSYFSEGIYSDTLTNSAGCDSILTLDLTVISVYITELYDTICRPDAPYSWGGELIYTAGLYSDTLAHVSGSDSIINLYLTVWEESYSVLDTNICSSEAPFWWNGNPYNVSGTYFDTLTNAVGCDSLLTLNLIINEGVSSDTFVTACETYTWLDGTGATYTESGIYEYSNGGAACADTMWLHLLISPPIDLLSTVQAVSCYGGNNGAIDLAVSGGIEPYSFLWSNGEKTQNIGDLTAGTYTVWLTDSIGCTDSLLVELSEPDAIVLSETHVDLGYSSDPVGSIDLTVESGGTGPFSYLWSTGDSTEDISGLPAGDYTVVVTDANNCEAILTVTLTSDVLTAYRMECVDAEEITCFEDLSAYPMATTLGEYLALDTSLEVYSDFGLDTLSFSAKKAVWEGSSYCYAEIRTYSITDLAGNTMECVQNVIVDDKVKPTITCPSALTVFDGVVPDAYASEAEFLAAGGSFDDNCGIVSFAMVDEQSNGGSEPETITRTYEVSDYCGNLGTCSQEIHVFTNAEIVLECSDLPKVYYDCNDYRPSYTLEQFDLAGGNYYSSLEIDTFTYVDKVSGDYCPTITRTYTLTNVIGQEAVCSQMFEVLDTVAPTLILPDKHIYCNESWPVYSKYTEVNQYRTSHGNEASDNCGLRSIRSVSAVSFKEAQGSCPTVYERVYRITDQCGNSSETSEFIYVYDTIAPVIASTPGDLTEDCELPEPYLDYAAFVADGGEVSEDCGDFTMAYVGDSVASTGVVYRTYRFSDACNFADYVQKITILDTIPPVFTQMPETITVDCEPTLFVSWSEFVDLGGWATDNCVLDTSSFALVSSVSDGDNCPRTYSNTYEIYDIWGNRADTVHLVIVVDEELPVLACPADDTIAVDADFPLAIETLQAFVTAGGTASDNCTLDSASFTLVQVDTSKADCYESVSYSFIVADMCGNWSETCSYSLFRFDDTAPEMYCLADTTVQCIDDVPAKITTYAEFVSQGGLAVDSYSLDESSFVWLTDKVEGDGCPLIITRTYQIANVCGIPATCSYQIRVDDTTPPVIVCPPDSSILCMSDLVDEITSFDEFMNHGGEISDNCAIDISSFAYYKETEYEPGNTTIKYHYSVKDMCGNADSCTRVITLSDTIPPDAVCNEITVYLDDEGNYLFTDIDRSYISAGSTDNCTAEEDLIIDIDVVEFTCEDVEEGKMINVVVTDEAGNSGNCVAMIVVGDTIPPVALCKADTVYLDEYGQVSITPEMIDNGSFDNCELVSIELTQDVFDCTEVGENVVGLIVTDAWGYSDSCYTEVTVLDTISPYLTCVGSQIIQLDENAQYALTWEMLTDSVSDQCAVDTVLLDRYELDCDDIGISNILLTAYDVNGNWSQCEAELEIIGNSSPNVQPDTIITVMNVAVTDFDVVSNDYDLKTSINPASINLVSNPAYGAVEVLSAGKVSYTPALDFVGTDVFMYSVCDDGIPCEPMCGEAEVYVIVLDANLPPLAINDSFDVPCVNVIGNVFDDNGLGADYDPDGDAISVNTTVVASPVNGSVVLYADGSFEYEPFYDFVEGIDSFMYEISDDGLPNLLDSAWVYITRVPDNDCDGIADVDDIDDDNDGIRDVNEGDMAYDSDNDGIPDSWDIDSDNDGILDNIEGQGEDNYIPPLGRDSNGNGWDDAYDPEDGGWPFDIDLTDTDGDLTPDFLDIDSDNDGVFDYIEGNDDNSDGIADVIRFYSDSDFDGLDDVYDLVSGWAMPFNETGSNAPLQDFDSDGVRDWRDTNDEDDDYQTSVEDLNGDGDYSNDDLDLDGYPEYLDTEMDCELFIPEGFSPNDDGVHDFFQILCIYPRYPDAKMMIFNRNGQKLFEKENYGNYDVWGWEDAWWWGTSENTLTIGRSGGLPAGNYVYVLQLGNGEAKSGTVMIAY